MKTITEKKHIQRLNEKEIVIENVFLRKEKELIRRTDGKILDEVFNATLIRKNYFFKGKCVYTETDFEKISNYTFANYDSKEPVRCPNCGNDGIIGEFYEGCPYCGTNFNIDYNYKRYDINFWPIGDNLLLVLLLFAFLIFPFMIIAYMYTSIKLNNFLYLLFLILPVILFIIIIKKFPKNIRENESEIINCLNYELKNYYYSKEEYNDLIDFHIKKYNKINNKKIDNFSYIEIEYTVNKYYFINNEIIKKVDTEKILMKKNNKSLNTIKEKSNIAECVNCGAPADITKMKCEYCNTIITKNIGWILIKLQVFDNHNK